MHVQTEAHLDGHDEDGHEVRVRMQLHIILQPQLRHTMPIDVVQPQRHCSQVLLFGDTS